MSRGIIQYYSVLYNEVTGGIESIKSRLDRGRLYRSRDMTRARNIPGQNLEQVTSDERTDCDGIESLRSTYSFPYNWLFPFDKRSQGAPKRTRNEHPLPELLRARVFFGIKEADESILSDTQRAMGRYWISVSKYGFNIVDLL